MSPNRCCSIALKMTANAKKCVKVLKCCKDNQTFIVID